MPWYPEERNDPLRDRSRGILDLRWIAAHPWLTAGIVGSTAIAWLAILWPVASAVATLWH